MGFLLTTIIFVGILYGGWTWLASRQCSFKSRPVHFEKKLHKYMTCAKIWEIVSDLPKYGEWCTFIKHIGLGGKLEAGTTLDIQMKLPVSDTDAQFEEVLLSVRPPNAICWCWNKPKLFDYDIPKGYLGCRYWQRISEDSDFIFITDEIQFTGILAPIAAMVYSQDFTEGYQKLTDELEKKILSIHG